MSDTSRYTTSLPQSEFERVLSLQSSQEWIKRRDPALGNLFEECSNNEEKKLIIDLLENYTNIDEAKEEKIFAEIKSMIVDTWHLNHNNTLIVGLFNDNEAGSGAAIVTSLRPSFAGTSWTKEKFVIKMTASIEILKKDPSITNIVFIDDFIGTGKTFTKLMDWYQEKLSEEKITKVNIYLTAICMLEISKDRIRAKTKNYFSSIYMSKGIKNKYIGKQLDDAIENMENIEKNIFPSSFLKNYSFGFGKSEALFRYGNNNASNNNFPIFWGSNKKKETGQSSSKRITLQSRI